MTSREIGLMLSPGIDARDSVYTLAALLRVRQEIAAMEQYGALREVLE